MDDPASAPTHPSESLAPPEEGGGAERALDAPPTRRLADRMRVVASAAAGVVSAGSREALRSALEAACRKVIPFDALSVLTYDAGSAALQPVGEHRGGRLRGPIRADGTPWERVLRERRPLLTAHAEDLAEQRPLAGEPASRAESVILAPILASDEVLGILAVESETPDRYTAQDVEVVEGLAALAAAALANLRLAEERRAAEQARLLSETRFRAMFEQFPLSVQIFDPEGRTLDVNRAWEELFRLPLDFLKEFNPLHDPQLEPVRDYLVRGFAGETLTIPPHPFVPGLPGHEGATLHWLEVTVCPVRAPDGTIREVIVVHRDVTEQQETAEALRASEESYRTMFELAADALFVHDIETGAILDANRKACELHGCTLEVLKEIGVGGIGDGAAPFDGEHARALVQQAAAGEPQRVEWLVRDAAGEPVWVEVYLHRVRILGVDRVLASVRSIQARKQAEDALRRAHDELEQRVEERTAELAQAEQRFRAIVEAGPTPLLFSRLEDGLVLYANPRLDALLGAEPGSLTGRRTPDFYYDLADRPRVLEAVRGQGYVHDLELRIRRADGTPRWVSLTVQRLVFGGEPALATAFLDITERKQIEQALRESEEHFRRLIENASDLITIIGPDGVSRYQSPSFERVLGYRPEERTGTSPFELMHPDDAPLAREVLGRMLREPGTTGTVEFRYRHRDGSWRVFEATGRTLLPDSAAEGVVLNSRDVTERAEAEQALGASEASYRGLFDTLTELVYVQDLEGRFLNVNEAVVRAYGYTREELIGQTPDLLGAPGTVDPEAFAETFRRAVAGEPQRFQWWGRRKDGGIFPKEVVIQRTTYFGQDVVIAVARDVTAQKAAEAALQRSEEHFRSLIENASDVITILDAQGLVRYQSPALQRILGYEPGELDGRNVFEYIAPEDVAPTAAALRRAVEAPGRTEAAEYRFRHKDGSWRILEGQGTTLSPTSAAEGVVINSRDVTERAEAERALRFQKTLLEAEGEASIDGILVVSSEGKILSYNKRFVELWGIPPEVVAARSDEAAIQAVLDCLQDPQAFLDRVAHLYAHPDEEARDEITLRDGRTFDRYSAPVKSSDGEHYGRIWFFRDMTAQKQHAAELEQARREAERAREQASQYAHSLERSLEELRATQEHLVQQEKMASLGRLTSGIAHEIKNPLNFITNFAQVNVELVADLRSALDAGDAAVLAELLSDFEQNTRKVQEHGRRANTIIQGMMEHAKATAEERGPRRPVDVNALVEEQIALALDRRPKGEAALPVVIRRDYGEAVGTLAAEPQELSRVVQGLLANALDAVEERAARSSASSKGASAAPPGYTPTITVRTRREGAAITLAVSDNGEGIAEEMRDRVFEPFFTTRPAGSGHPGLGLSLAHETVVTRYGGWLEVESAEGVGTTFTVTLIAW